jgi:hypothetical protein
MAVMLLLRGRPERPWRVLFVDPDNAHEVPLTQVST